VRPLGDRLTARPVRQSPAPVPVHDVMLLCCAVTVRIRARVRVYVVCAAGVPVDTALFDGKLSVRDHCDCIGSIGGGNHFAELQVVRAEPANLVNILTAFATLPSYCPVIVSPCLRVTLSSCHLLTVSPSHRVALSSCRPVIVSPCHRVALSSCHPRALLPFRSMRFATNAARWSSVSPTPVCTS
jgi:hypothetical protein